MNLTLFSQKVYTVARDKGWWDRARNSKEICQLFISEISEATECVRNGEPPVHYGQMGKITQPFWTRDVETCGTGYKEFVVGFKKEPLEPWKPEGEAIECADLLIRVADWFGANTWDLGAECKGVLEFLGEPTFENVRESLDVNFYKNDYAPDKLSAHFNLVQAVVEAQSGGRALDYAILFVETCGYMYAQNWDVAHILNIKAKYNESRPYRHGGKLA